MGPSLGVVWLPVWSSPSCTMGLFVLFGLVWWNISRTIHDWNGHHVCLWAFMPCLRIYKPVNQPIGWLLMAVLPRNGFSMPIGTYGVPPWSILWFPCARTRWIIYIVQYFENWLIYVLYLTILSSYVIEFWPTIANFGVDLYSYTEQHRWKTMIFCIFIIFITL